MHLNLIVPFYQGPPGVFQYLWKDVSSLHCHPDGPTSHPVAYNIALCPEPPPPSVYFSPWPILLLLVPLLMSQRDAVFLEALGLLPFLQGFPSCSAFPVLSPYLASGPQPGPWVFGLCVLLSCYLVFLHCEKLPESIFVRSLSLCLWSLEQSSD